MKKEQPLDKRNDGIGDFSLYDVNFAPQFLSPLPYILFSLASHDRPKHDELMDMVALYLRQPSHNFDMLLKPCTETQWTINARITFDYAEFEKGPLIAHEDGINSEAPIVMESSAAASFVYGMMRDSTKSNNRNITQASIAAHMVKQSHRSLDPPFLMRSLAIQNDPWPGQSFEQARTEFESGLVASFDADIHESLRHLHPDVHDAFLTQHGTSQFLCVGFSGDAQNKGGFIILGARANEIKNIMTLNSLDSAVTAMDFLEKSYILPNLISEKPGRAAMFAKQAKDLLHFSHWQERAIKKDAISLLGPRPT